jgi:hypothetical protein
MEALFRQNTAVETAPLQQEAVLFHPGANRFCILNRTSAFIWNRLSTPASAQQIATELSASFAEVTEEGALEDVRQALAEFVALDLVCSVGDPVA